MKNKNKVFLPLILSIIISLIIVAVSAIAIHISNTAPERKAKDFYNSLLPDYNADKLQQCVGSEVYKIRFDDDGYFVDRYERTRKQIVYYYGENFKSTLSDFIIYDVGDTELSSIKREYMSKYSLEIDEIKKVSFTITLSSEYEQKSRTEVLTLLKANGDWLVYDYDAYWFAYM